MNSRTVLLIGWLMLSFFWLLTPSRSQYFVPTTVLQDQALQMQLDTAYDHIYGIQSTQAQQQGLEQAQNAWLTYRVSEAFWEAGTKDVNNPEFQKAMSRMTQARIDELGKMVMIHPADNTPASPPTPRYVPNYQNGLNPQRPPTARPYDNTPDTPPPSLQPRFY